MLKIAIGADHGGFALKQEVVRYLVSKGMEVDDVGAHAYEREDDYPEFAIAVAERVAGSRCDRGILICTTGTGMAIAANRFRGVRAALGYDADAATRSVSHNNANVLVLAASKLDIARASEILDAWFAASFSPEVRHARRVAMIERGGRLGETATLARLDPEVHAAIAAQIHQEDTTINLIASENYTTRAVREAQGSVFTNKYAEGYPSKRWYGGCGPVDAVETLAIERAKALFGAEAANVQPHCGAFANLAVYLAMLEPGDTILAMSLDQGGHLSHGSPANISGKSYRIVPYTLDPETEVIDYDAAEELALREKPRLILAGASAYPRLLDFARFRDIADKAGAYLLVDMAHIAGLVAGGAHPSPVPYADFVTSTTHKTLRGPRGGLILCREKYLKAINHAIFPGMQGGPLEHAIAAKAVCFREAMAPGFKQYAEQVVKNSIRLCSRVKELGFRIVSGGTDNHLFLVDVASRGLTGKLCSAALEAAGIIANKNTIPYDRNSPFITSGIRIGTPSVTTRGMKEAEMDQIADWIAQVLAAPEDAALHERIRNEVAVFASRFPVP
ncbi:MAG: ribose 5-phosphate isomerase B [Kiritimatiellia bacterium]|jgi:glycine hydroxymethyltransferase